MKIRFVFLFVFALVLSAVLIPYQKGSAATGTGDLVMVNPGICPDAGCAAGQRLNLRVDFELSVYVPQPPPSDPKNPNVQICLYEPTAWGASSSVSFAPAGSSSALNVYTPDATSGTVCSGSQPANYQWIGGASASLTTAQIWDSLNFALRIPATAAVSDALTVMVFEKTDATTWTRTHQAIRPIAISPASTNAYVAASPSGCNGLNPCYVNSGDDLPDGLGTGLKDAIDAQTTQSTITILGNYAIKSSTILIDKPHIIQGMGDASITFTGLICTQPMLLIKSGATLRNLNINDGSCTTTHRDLVVVDSLTRVSLQSNDLVNGNNAVRVIENNGDTSLSFNNIQNNSGYGVLWVLANPALPTPGIGMIDAWANNIANNRLGTQANCSNHGKMQHNYWGGGVTVAGAVAQCEASDAKRLGAPILPHSGAPGVDATLVSVTTTRQNAFANQIGFQRSLITGETGNLNDFNMVIVNHGSGSNQNIPFAGTNQEGVNSCGNFWDIFLPAATNPQANLNLFFKYNFSSGCVAAINTTAYCGQTDHPEAYPLWWFDPSGSAGTVWKTTGSTGQTTTCNTADSEIHLEIDSSGRPGMIQDMQFVPFVVGFAINPTPTPTHTYTATLVPTKTLTRTPTRTPTRTLTKTTYYYYSTTRAPSTTPVKTRTSTPTRIGTKGTTTITTTRTYGASNSGGDGSGYPVGTPNGGETQDGYASNDMTPSPEINGTLEGTPSSGTLTITPTPPPAEVTTQTPSPTATPLKVPEGRASFWISLITGSVLGLIILGGGAWVLFRQRLKM